MLASDSPRYSKLLKQLTPELLEYFAPGIDTNPYVSCAEEVKVAYDNFLGHAAFQDGHCHCFPVWERDS